MSKLNGTAIKIWLETFWNLKMSSLKYQQKNKKGLNNKENFQKYK